MIEMYMEIRMHGGNLTGVVPNTLSGSRNLQMCVT